jgi:hypothetical protein
MTIELTDEMLHAFRFAAGGMTVQRLNAGLRAVLAVVERDLAEDAASETAAQYVADNLSETYPGSGLYE